jgi:predicted CXXCH cytochrome family protein
VNKEEPAKDPHGDPAMCSSCHTSAVGGRSALRFDGNVSQLCQSCHNGRLATREVHSVDMAPSRTIAGKIPSDFPLKDGMLTCLSCHDVVWGCEAEQPAVAPNRNWLRGTRVSHPLAFCFRCHVQENYRSFNAHDQLEAGKAKTDTCVWCHVTVPDVNSPLKEAASYGLRSESFGVCSNCHLVAKDHPIGDSHMYATPSAKMTSYMSAYEIQPRMRLPLERLLGYVRAAKRAPRSIPLGENGRITCYSCHNPHEKGLLPNWSPRSVGAGPKQATNYRRRAREGIVCRACHEK